MPSSRWKVRNNIECATPTPNFAIFSTERKPDSLNNKPHPGPRQEKTLTDVKLPLK